MGTRTWVWLVVASTFLCGVATPSEAAIITLQYDDGIWEAYTNCATGQAVRFTVPSTGPPLKLDTLWILTAPVASNNSIGVKVWEDDGGSIGSVMYEFSATPSGTYPNPNWDAYDTSAGNLIFSPGDSFFAGFHQSGDLFGFYDKTSPDDRTWWRADSLGWCCNYWKPSDYDAMIRADFSAIPEPSAFITWSLLGAFGITVGWWRRRRKGA